MLKTIVAFLVLSISLPSISAEYIKYRCNNLSYDVEVKFNGTKPVAIYGIITEGDEDGNDEENARRYVRLFNLQVSPSKSEIKFEVLGDFGSPYITCKKLN